MFKEELMQLNLLALPHCVTQDDEYLGYRIPKGSTIVANIWKIAHDPDLYPDPFSFSPERFLNSDSAQNQLDPKKFVFGFGRRTCPGAQFAELSIFLNVASILSAFTISKAVDTHGKEISPELDFTTAITSLHCNTSSN
ncbi:cytochrome P450 [Crucibulum laeve]|uniref:Cytochrome P450 n=1 Tax=Crucibulum laeve TaxID=68775 RepID=A0A5C3LN34_9AGAR|nr:cytochrome P450 [Crucibulum laeve]